LHKEEIILAQKQELIDKLKEKDNLTPEQKEELQNLKSEAADLEENVTKVAEKELKLKVAILEFKKDLNPSEQLKLDELKHKLKDVEETEPTQEIAILKASIENVDV